MKALLLLIFFCQSTFAEYAWYGLDLNLPFPQDWYANKKKRKDPKDPLVFFGKGASPRVAATLYHTNYDLLPKDYSAFTDQFLKSKKAWMKKESANLLGKIVTKLPKSPKEPFSYRFSFANKRGVFMEVGLYARCGDKGMTLKAILPQSKWETPEAKKIIDFMEVESPCHKQKASSSEKVKE